VSINFIKRTLLCVIGWLVGWLVGWFTLSAPLYLGINEIMEAYSDIVYKKECSIKKLYPEACNSCLLAQGLPTVITQVTALGNQDISNIPELEILCKQVHMLYVRSILLLNMVSSFKIIHTILKIKTLLGSEPVFDLRFQSNNKFDFHCNSIFMRPKCVKFAIFYIDSSVLL